MTPDAPSRRLLLPLAPLLLFAAFVAVDHAAHEARVAREIEQHSRLLAAATWNIDTDAAQGGLSAMQAGGRYARIELILAGGGVLARVEGAPPSGPLSSVGVIHTHTIDEPVMFRGERIGTLRAVAIHDGRVRYLITLALLLVGTLLLLQRTRLRQLRRQREAERQEADRALQELGLRLRTVVSGSPIILFTLDPAGRFTLLQGKGLDLLGLAAEEMIGQPAETFERRVPLRAEHLRRALAGESFNQIVTSGERVFDTWYSPLLDDAQAPAGVIGVSTDVTELERSNEDLRQFAWAASHDLQEPLRMVATFLERLKQEYVDQLDQRASQYLDFAVDGAERMRRLVRDLLSYAQVGQGELALRPVDAEQILASVLTGLRGRIEESGAEIRAGDLPRVEADPTLLAQVLQNLIKNAIDHNDQPKPVISISAREVPPVWRFEVSDNGPGVPADRVERVFELFERLSASGAGTGIGLSLARRAVERMGGGIGVEPGAAGGACFYFTLAAADQG